MTDLRSKWAEQRAAADRKRTAARDADRVRVAFIQSLDQPAEPVTAEQAPASELPK